MKRFSKLLSFIALVLVIIFSLATCDDLYTSGQNGNNPGGTSPGIVDRDPSHFKFDPATGTITGYTGPGGAVEIPSAIGGVTVTAIGEAVFHQNKNLTSVVIPDSVTNVGLIAFYGCSELVSMTLPCHLLGQNTTKTTIRSNLVSVTVTGNGAIPKDGFDDCSALERVTIGAGITSVSEDEFDNCVSLTSIQVDPGNSAYSSENGVLFDKEKTTLILFPEGLTGSYRIPDSVTQIGPCAFELCKGLTSVTIPYGVTIIDYGAFASCTGLTNVSIPESVTVIGSAAFYNCTGFTSVTIPESVTDIGGSSFAIGGSGNTSTFSNTHGAFDGCSALTSVTIPARLTGQFAEKFKGFTNLSLSLTGSGSIPNNAFISYYSQWYSTRYYCNEITSMFIGDNVTGLSPSSFAYLYGLKQITVSPSNLSCSSIDGVLYNKEQTSIVYVPANLSGSITIPSGITRIGERGFSYRPNLTSINVDPANTEFSSIDGVLLSKDKKLLIQFPAGHVNTTYTVPSSVETIGAWAFEGCEKLTSVTIPNSVDKIRRFFEQVLQYIPVVSWFIPDDINRYIDGVSTIEPNAFAYCKSLTSVTFGGAAIYDNRQYELEAALDLLSWFYGGGDGPSRFDVINFFGNEVGSKIFNNGNKSRGFYDDAFPQSLHEAGGNALKTAYQAGGAGTYRRSSDGNNWTKTSF